MIQIGIVAHTSRIDQAKKLVKTVSADYISVDDGTLQCDDNHEAVLTHLAGIPSSFSVVLEDDAQPVEDFRQQIEACLPMSPSPIVSFYLGKKRPPHWQTRIKRALADAKTVNASWLVSTHLLHAVGYAIRTDLIPSLLDHITTLPVDQHIGNWARQYGHLISYTNPSLVDHLDGPTIVDHPDGQPREAGRKAWAIGGRDHWTSTSTALK
jgi:hypothetical protein